MQVNSSWQVPAHTGTSSSSAGAVQNAAWPGAALGRLTRSGAKWSMARATAREEEKNNLTQEKWFLLRARTAILFLEERRFPDSRWRRGIAVPI